jgi:2-polyprenyl-6-methoxyphenol hydroxylase-like FAD-dependent oxidoreductase
MPEGSWTRGELTANQPMRIAIIGGGIGGLTAALALRQFGFEPQVFEQAPELRDVGAAIIMWPNAMRVLHRLGLAETIRLHGGLVEQTEWLRQDGRKINRVPLPKSDAPAIVLHRADLQHTLLSALPQGSIHLGRVFESFEQLPEKIVAHFHNGSPFECDVLIGADGLHSHVRAQLLDDGPPIDRGYSSWRGVAPHTPAWLTPATAYEIYGPGQRFGIGPLGRGRVGWWATANTRRDKSNESGQVDRPHLLDLFAGWCEPVPELIQATPLSSLVRNEIFDRLPSRKWGEGSMTLLGDAIHPTTPNLGQGGCLAIEDAAVLARCLHKYGGSAALRKFEQLRFARTTAIALYSRAYGAAGQWENRLAVKLRGLVLSTLPRWLAKRLFDGIFSYDAYTVSI